MKLKLLSWFLVLAFSILGIFFGWQLAGRLVSSTNDLAVFVGFGIYILLGCCILILGCGITSEIYEFIYYKEEKDDD